MSHQAVRPALFSTPQFDYNNANNISSAAAFALQNVVLSLNATIIALTALQLALQAYYRTVAPSSGSSPVATP